MSFYTVPKTINWTLTDAHAADLCLNEVEGEYKQILSALYALAKSYPKSSGGFKANMEVAYSALREVLSGC